MFQKQHELWGLTSLGGGGGGNDEEEEEDYKQISFLSTY